MTLLARRLERLRGQTAWITGGKRIGHTVALTLAEQGVNVILSYRFSNREAEETAAAVRCLGVRSITVQADVSLRTSVAKAVEVARGQFPQIDILVNMASVYREVRPEDADEEDWKDNVGAHILGTFWPVQLIAPLMPPGSRIINIADVTSIGRPYHRNVPYIATKAAVAGMTRALALDYGERGLFVNAIAPGPILPPEGYPPAAWQRIRERYPVKYPMTDEEAIEQFALLVLYLCTATMSSGHTYPLDQGQNL
ncbi:MAG TPA: SDR family oxidoreductase [Bryobacteraceae bacterium]|nr:SDR family oxidoreductase [Bryobacteraceae bacterium]